MHVTTGGYQNPLDFGVEFLHGEPWCMLLLEAPKDDHDAMVFKLGGLSNHPTI